MAENKKGGLFKRTVKEVPEYLSDKEKEKLFLEAMKNLQKLERDNMGRESVTRLVGKNEPIQVIVASDWHLGSIASDIDAMITMRDYILENDNVGVVFAGDEIEGMVSKYLNTNAARTPIDVQQQIEFLRAMFFEPLAEAGKVLGMVSGYWGHPGWAMDATTINTWMAMAGGLDIPIIQNGGELRIRFPNGYEHSIRIWHNPPGSSKYDEVVGLREAMLGTSESSRTNGAINGHIHRMGVAEESYAGAKLRVYYISAGTMKGSNPNLPRDRFGENLGMSLSQPQGQGVIIHPKIGRREERQFPFANLEQGQMANKALTILDRVEAQGMKEELIERIHKKVEAKPEIFYTSAMSRLGSMHTEERPLDKVAGGETIRNPYSKMVMRAPYDTLSFDVRTKLPIVLNLVQDVRTGSSSEGFKDLQLYVNEIAKNPHSLVVFLRNMIDKDAGDSPDRVKILDRLSGLINGVSGQTLAIMMDESMRMPSWKKEKFTGEVEEWEDENGRTRSKRIYTHPIAPASYLANATGVPLIHHLSLIKLGIGPGSVLKAKPMYIGAFADKLEGHGSGSKPTWGPQRLYDLHLHEKPGYVVGGHMQNAGVSTFYDSTNAETNYPILIQPGWWAKSVDSAGKGNVKPGAEPGQAIIFMPGNSKRDYRAFPTISVDQTKYMSDALMLLQGLEYMGLTEKVLKLK